MARIVNNYSVRYNDKDIGTYYELSDGNIQYYPGWGCPWDIEEELKALKLDKEISGKKKIKAFSDLIKEEYRVQGRKRKIYRNGPLELERRPEETDERFSVYRRSAEKDDPDYSPLKHDAPHNEGPHTPEGMREWCSWYAFNKMDDGTYEAELDEAWWWGGGHNDGGTIHREIPEEWFELPYEEFLDNVVGLAAAWHYGFTAEILLEREGLREFFGYEQK